MNNKWFLKYESFISPPTPSQGDTVPEIVNQSVNYFNSVLDNILDAARNYSINNNIEKISLSELIKKYGYNNSYVKNAIESMQISVRDTILRFFEEILVKNLNSLNLSYDLNSLKKFFLDSCIRLWVNRIKYYNDMNKRSL